MFTILDLVQELKVDLYGLKFETKIIIGSNDAKWVSFNFGEKARIYSADIDQLIYFTSNIHFLFYSLVGCLSNTENIDKFCENLK